MTKYLNCLIVNLLADRVSNLINEKQNERKIENTMRIAVKEIVNLPNSNSLAILINSKNDK